MTRSLIHTPITNFRETDAGHWLLAMTEDEHDPEPYITSLIQTGQALAAQTPQPVVEAETGAVDITPDAKARSLQDGYEEAVLVWWEL